MKRTGPIALLAGAVCCAVLVPAASSSGSKHKARPTVKKVAVGDDFFAPTKLTIRKGNEVNFVWNRSNYDSHNVTLIKGPKGVGHARFTSITGAIGIHFKPTFVTPGTYHFECTIHPATMNMTVLVKK